MKILAVGMNYREHVSELANSVPDEPVIFMKPDSSLLHASATHPASNMPFFLPDFAEEFHYETEVVVRISKLGKTISPAFAATYYHEVTIGIDLTARDLQRRLRRAGLPWELCKGFDQSAVIGDFVSLTAAGPIQDLHFSMKLNGQVVQEGHTADMIFPVDEVIAFASRFFTLKTGDLFYTGTPAGVGRLAVGDHLEGYLGDRKLLDLRIR
jgi:2-keto-4-pentenoate hydratase/2-oxohepta-3-ene-1,7-dioic acid hydratase in catechol pathway